MIASDFEQIFEHQVNQSREVLLKKAKEYATDNDRLSNFKKAAVLTGGTPEQALWGFLAKHLISLTEMVSDEEDHPVPMWEEKLGDAINYLILLRAQVQETANARASTNIVAGSTINLTTDNPAIHLS